MAIKKNPDMSLEKLKEKESALKKIIPVFAVIIGLLTAAGVFLTFRNGFGVFTALPIVFIGIFIANVANLKSIRKEIADRDE